MNNIYKDFQDAVNYVNNNKYLKIPENDKLNLYKYYKQSTIGNININKPTIFTLNHEPLLKYNAWLSVENISKENAMLEYTKIANKYKLQNNDLINKLISINNNLQKR